MIKVGFKLHALQQPEILKIDFLSCKEAESMHKPLFYARKLQLIAEPKC